MEEDLDAGCTPERQERRDARENRQHILAVAKRLFATRGVDATSMKDIAYEAGVGKGTLYRHFADKGELCASLIHVDIAEFQERVGILMENVQSVPSSLARLDIMIAERIRIMEWHLPLFAAMEEARVGAQKPGSFRGPFSTWTHTQIIGLLNEAIAKGEVGALDVAFIADTILAAVSPALYSYQRHECGYSIERIIAGLRSLFIDGLRHSSAA